MGFKRRVSTTGCCHFGKYAFVSVPSEPSANYVFRSLEFLKAQSVNLIMHRSALQLNIKGSQGQ